MKKIAFVFVSVLIVSLAAAPAFALDPVLYPFEGHAIQSYTDVELEGHLILDQDYLQEVCHPQGEVIATYLDDCCDPGDVVFQGPINVNAGFVRYVDENNAYDGTVSMRKDFAAFGQPRDSGDNVDASKSVGYVSSSPFGVYTADETAGLGVRQSTGVAIHWDLANQVGQEAIALTAFPDNLKERRVAMGSDMSVTFISAHTNTGLNLFGNTVTASYDIDADAIGTVGSGMIARYQELYIAEMDFDDYSEADGVFEFRKTMDVDFNLDPPAVHPFDDLAPLCPYNAAAPQDDE